MSRCGCSGSSCSCVLKGAGSVSVTGAGTVSSPYTISANLYLAAGSSGNVALTITGSGSSGDPYTINASQAMALDDLTDVNASGGSTGNVLAKQADGSFALVPATTAPVGAISTDGSLSGDGSAGDPLGVVVAAGGGLTVTPTGLAVSGATGWQTYTPTLTTSTGNTITPDPGTTIQGRYKVDGDTVHVNIIFNAGLNIPVSSGNYSLSLPVPARGSQTSPQLLLMHAQTSNSTSGQKMGYGIIEGGSSVTRMRIDSGDWARNVSETFPTWGAYAHRFTLHGYYEAA